MLIFICFVKFILMFYVSDAGLTCQHVTKAVDLSLVKKSVSSSLWLVCSECLKERTMINSEPAAFQDILVCLKCGFQVRLPSDTQWRDWLVPPHIFTFFFLPLTIFGSSVLHCFLRLSCWIIVTLVVFRGHEGWMSVTRTSILQSHWMHIRFTLCPPRKGGWVEFGKNGIVLFRLTWKYQMHVMYGQKNGIDLQCEHGLGDIMTRDWTLCFWKFQHMLFSCYD